MHTRLLKYLDAVVRHGSIRRAAEAVNVAPSAINRHLLDLEVEIGAPLFERLPRGVRLTAAGEILFHHVRSTIRGYDRALSEIDQLKTGTRGRITVAAIESVMSDVLPDAVFEFSRLYPRVEFTVMGQPAQQAVQAVLDGAADLCMIFNPVPKLSLNQVVATDFPLGIIVSPSHPLAGKTTAMLSDLKGWELVMPDQSITIFHEIDHVLSRLALRLPPRIVTGSMSFMSAYVERSEAIGIMTPVGIGQQLREGHLRFIPLEDRGIGPQRLIAGVIDSAMPVAAANFCLHLKTYLPTWKMDISQK